MTTPPMSSQCVDVHSPTLLRLRVLDPRTVPFGVVVFEDHDLGSAVLPAENNFPKKSFVLKL